MNRILVAVDFSPCSRAALSLATALAQRQRSSLLLAHAVGAAPLEVPSVPMGMTAQERDMVMAAEAEVARDASEIRRRGITVETRVVLGSAAKTLADMARELDAKLIVMGTHGRKGAAHLFLGSVAEQVVRAATCPVLVTRDGAIFDVSRWEGTEPLRLLVGTDGSRATEAALSLAGSFARSNTCDLSLLRLYWQWEELARYGLDNLWDDRPHHRELLQLLDRDLKRDAENLIGGTPSRVRFRAANRHNEETIADEVLLAGTDVLVVGIPKHGMGRGASIAPKAVLRSSLVPVLCVPEAMAPVRQQPPQVRSVLVASDLSEGSRDVVFQAYGLLRPTGGRVELCTIHEQGSVDRIADLPSAPPLGEEDRAALDRKLRAQIPSSAEAVGMKTGVSVLEGRVASEAIIAAAERLDVDLIVVGSHGRSGIKRAMLGSVAEEVSRHASRPVLIVRTPAGVDGGRP